MRCTSLRSIRYQLSKKNSLAMKMMCQKSKSNEMREMTIKRADLLKSRRSRNENAGRRMLVVPKSKTVGRASSSHAKEADNE